MLSLTSVFAQPNSVKQATEAKITALLGKMTLEKKVGQMAQVAIDQAGATNYATRTFNIDTGKLNDILWQCRTFAATPIFCPLHLGFSVLPICVFRTVTAG